MKSNKWVVFVLLFVAVSLFVGCEEAEALPQNRELVVINGTTDSQITGIEIAAFPFGQRKFDVNGSFSFREDNPLDVNEQFGIVLSLATYRVVVVVAYDYNDGLDIGSRRVTIDLPVKTSLPTYITLVNDGDMDFPGYTIEVSGEHVAYNVPLLL